MSDHDPNMTAEEFITNLHISISYVDDDVLRSEMIDYMNAIKDQIQSLEDSYNLSPYEANRRL